MRNSVSLIFFLLFCLSCHDTTGTYSIDGSARSVADGEIITITTIGDSLPSLIQCRVKDGKFHIDGITDCGKVAYVGFKDAEENAGSLFFIEKGEIEIYFDTATCHVTGTPLNERYSIIEDSIGYYVTELEKIETQYYSIDGNNDELVRISVKGLQLQEKLVNYLHTAVKENVHNAIGLYLLVVYNQLFTAGELCYLMKQVPSSVIVGSNTSFYTTLTSILEERY